MEPWTVRVRHRGTELRVAAHADERVALLQERVHVLTQVPPANQKWLAQRAPGGPVPSLTRVVQRHEAEHVSLADAGVRDGSTLTMIGGTDDEVQGLREQESDWAKRHAPRTLHPSLLRGATPRSTATPSARPVFAQLAVHPSASPGDAWHARVLRYLERLASDPAVLHVCRTHGYEVGTLTELLPHEHPHLLGLNENRGQRILLRIRTDAADGTRDYKTTRRVLMHELAHNEVRAPLTRSRSTRPSSRS